jgi:crotonobetainyl-CoA:carnitine CoA-transferase CaiB-like acyl-CoA transferase
MHPVPDLGERTRPILTELGFPPDEIDALVGAEVASPRHHDRSTH